MFAHVLCHEKANKLPFRQLISLCHEILSKKEEIIFDESNLDRPQDSVEALRQLNKHVVVNLVFDGDMKQIEKSQEERANARAIARLEAADQEMADEEDDFDLAEPTVVKHAKSEVLPFAGLRGQKPQEEDKSHVY